MRRIILIIAFLSVFTAGALAQEQQSYTLTGRVLNESGEPLIGATIFLKDKPGGGAITNIDGNFTMNVVRYDVLVIQLLGYERYEHRLTVAGENNITIRLSSKTETLDDVVVVGMGTQRKVSVAGAITTINPAELEVPATNIVNNLAGRVAGVIAVQSSGEPGKNISEFWVRGIGTFGANSSALVLIDGLEGNLSQVDPADVESFSVLKDASATAVYGSRGANGVVIVTTKRGFEQKLKVTFRSNYTVSQLKRLPDYLRAHSYAEMANEAVSEMIGGGVYLYSPTEMEIIEGGFYPDIYPDVDWQKEILNPTSFQHTQYVSAQGGGSVARYFVSLGVSQESSAYRRAQDSKYNKGVGYDTYNYRLNLDINLTKTTQVYFGATGYMSINKRPSMGEEYKRNVSLTNWLWESQAKTTPLMYPLRYSTGELPAIDGENNIPPHVLLNYTGATKEENTRNLINMGVSQDLSMITKGLTAKVQGSWDGQNTFGESRYKMPPLYYAFGNYTNEGKARLVRTVDEVSSNYSSGSWTWRKLYFDANLNYSRTFDKHRVGGLLFYYLESTAESGSDSSMNAIPKRYQSLSGRATYGYDDTYFLDLNFGMNGSENFEPGKQYGFFPAMAMAWVPTNYGFMKRGVPWLNFLKFRGSYGIVGNDRISSFRFPYLTIVKEDVGLSSPWGGVGSITEERVGASNLAWETAAKFDIGVDMGLFNDKFKITADYFVDTRRGIYQQRSQIPDYVGVVSMPYGNVGSMKSWGGEGNFEFFQQLGKDWHLTLRGNFTVSKNKILNWEEANPRYPYLSKTGFGNDVQRGYVALGLFRDQQDVDMSPTQFGAVRPGDIKYKDVNGDGRVTEDDQVPLFSNSRVPQFVYGFGGELRYKRWTLNVLFKGTGTNRFLYGGTDGSKFDGYIPFNNGTQGNVLSIAYDQANRWTSAAYSGDPATENPNARFPRLYYGKNENNTKPSTFWQGDSRYLRLQELSLTYSFQTSGLKRALGIQSIDVQIMCQNLAVWDSVKLFDPEQAVDTGQAYPIPARYSLQFYLNF